MFDKKTLLSVLNLNLAKNGKVSFLDITMKVDKKNLEKLIEAGYDPILITSSHSYRYSKTFPGDARLYLSLILQDFLKGRFFNDSRYLAFCMIKKQVYKLALTEKELAIYNDAFEKDVPEQTVETEQTKQPNTSKKIIAFTSSSPRIGKTTTVNTLVKTFEEEGYVVDKHTIAEMIRVCLSMIAELLDKDSSRFFDNYHEKDISKTFGNETVPFKTRDLLCEFSIMIQKYYGVDIWGKTASDILSSSDANIIFIDDLRRKDELAALKETFGADLIVISLDKIDVNPEITNTQLSDAALQFESKISKENVDHFFVFNEDWSNTPELISLIRSLI